MLNRLNEIKLIHEERVKKTKKANIMKIILIVVDVVLIILLIVIIIFLEKTFFKKPKKTNINGNINNPDDLYRIDSKTNLNEKPKKRSIKI